jgi:hypothetical protein
MIGILAVLALSLSIAILHRRPDVLKEPIQIIEAPYLEEEE